MNVRLLVTFVRRFISCDLDLHIRTYLDILKMYLDNKNELSRSRLSKVNLFTADPVLSFFLYLPSNIKAYKLHIKVGRTERQQELLL